MHGIVKLSEAASIALHAVTVLAADSDRHLTVREIAEALPVSENHLAKVLQRLSKAGLVASVRGPGGGFRLRADARETTLLRVYEAVEGPLDVARCVFPDAQGCASCILDDALRAAGQLVRDRLAKARIADLAHTFRPRGLVKLARRTAAPARRRA